MSGLITSGLGFLGGAFAWFVTALIANPLVIFINARAEAARVLTLYKSHDVFDPDTFPQIDKERRLALDMAGSQLIAFTLTNSLLITALHWFMMYPRQAGEELRLLGSMKSYGANNEITRRSVIKHLRLGR